MLKKSLYIAIALIALVEAPSTAMAAIARDTYAVGTGVSGTSVTLSYNNNGDGMVIQCLNGTVGTPMTATYNGVAATLEVSATRNDGGSEVDYFWLASPAIGTHNAVCTSTHSSAYNIMVSSYTGTGGVDAVDAATCGGGGSCSGSITTTVSGDWIVGGGQNDNASSGGSYSWTGVTGLDYSPYYSGASFDSNGTVSTGVVNYSFTSTFGDTLLGAIAICPTGGCTGGGGGGGSGSGNTLATSTQDQTQQNFNFGLALFFGSMLSTVWLLRSRK